MFLSSEMAGYANINVVCSFSKMNSDFQYMRNDELKKKKPMRNYRIDKRRDGEKESYFSFFFGFFPGLYTHDFAHSRQMIWKLICAKTFKRMTTVMIISLEG